MEINKQAYDKYVKQVTPVLPLWVNMLRAFLTGGAICTVGQALINLFQSMGLDEKSAGIWNLLILILASVILTGLNIYPKLVKWGGAGALVPITGFANSVVAPLVEYQVEGEVYGKGVKAFTIAGPVILFGVFTSWGLGIIYWIGTLIGVV